MKKLLVVGALLSLLAGATLYWSAARSRVRPYTPLGPGPVYVALGDSLAAGYTVSRPADAYVNRIAAELQPVEVRNFAVPGETSASLLRRQLPQALTYIRSRRAAGKRVSPITLDIGGNDLRSAQHATPAVRRQTIAAVEANLGRVLDALVEATTGAEGRRTADIAVMTYYNPYPGDPMDQTSPAYWTAELNAAITRAGESRGVAVADVAGAFGGGNVYRYTYIAAGDIHANSDGHGLIAARFLAALRYNRLR